MIREQFLKDLKDRRFAIPYCNRCSSPAWPPLDRCNTCMSKVRLRRIKTPVGILIEHTIAHNMFTPVRFGVIEIDGIKLVGTLRSSIPPYVGMSLRMINCGVSADGTPFYEFG